MKENMKNKKAQLTIFVIVAIVILVSIVVIFTLQRYDVGDVGARENPEAYIRSCAKEAIEEAETLILDTNGYPEEGFNNYMIYRGENVPYLCKVSEFYSPCVPQDPIFSGKVSNDIEEYINPRVESCFEVVVREFEKAGYNVVEGGDGKSEVSFESEAIVTKIDKTLTITKEDESLRYNNFQSKVSSPLYSLVDSAEKITNYESFFCKFDHLDWMMKNPDLKIEKFSASDQTKVYTIIDRKSEKNLDIAIKSCMLPAGI